MQRLNVCGKAQGVPSTLSSTENTHRKYLVSVLHEGQLLNVLRKLPGEIKIEIKKDTAGGFQRSSKAN